MRIRPEDPDVVYTYDRTGRMISKIYAGAEPAGDIEHEWKFTWQGRLDTATAFVDDTPIIGIAKETFEYRTDGVATKIESDARVLTDTTWADYDEIARVVETTSTAFTHSIYEFDELSRRTAEVRGVDPADTTRPHTYAVAGSVVTEVTSDMDTTERVDYTWDNQGRASGRRVNVGGMVTDEAYQYGYHDRMLTLAIDDPERDPGCILSGIDSTNNNYSERETWAYRYSPSGLREQKRLMTDWVHDRNTCGTAPWTHYVLSGSGRPLVVYHGRQTSENPCTTDSFGLYDRRVYIYPFEFRAYGPDGVNVIFERDRDGEWVKRFVTKNRQGSIVGVNDADGYQDQALYENYGSRHNEWNRRTGWLDRERDYETSPNSAAHKLYDLDHRKYDQSSATFLSVDPLWMSNLYQGSYVYCEGDGINLVDPWGLAGEGGDGGITSEGGDTPGPGKGDSPTIQDGPSDYKRFSAEWWSFIGGYGGPWGSVGAGGGTGVTGGGTGGGSSSSAGGNNPGSKNNDNPSDKKASEHSLPPGMSKLNPGVYAQVNKPKSTDSWAYDVRPDRTEWVSSERSLREAANASQSKDYLEQPSLINNSNLVIFFKPESDMVIAGQTYSNSGAYALPPYTSWHYPIDGVRINNTETVQKVPNGVSVYFDGSSLRASDIVSWTWGVGADAFFNWFGIGNGQGEVSRAQLDDGWGGLFDTKVFSIW